MVTWVSGSISGSVRHHGIGQVGNIIRRSQVTDSDTLMILMSHSIVLILVVTMANPGRKPCLCLFGVWLTMQTVHASERPARVLDVIDGDTLTVLLLDSPAGSSPRDVRLCEIDAPERGQDFGPQARATLTEWLQGQEVRLDVQKTDRYDRLVGRVWLNGRDVGLEQVKKGMAWVRRKPPAEPAYDQAEQQARSAREGLWSAPGPLPPWSYRNIDVRWQE